MKMYINAYKSTQIHRNLKKSTQIYLNPIQIHLGTFFFQEKKSACGSQEDLAKLITYQKVLETPFWVKKKACDSREDLTKLTHLQNR